MTTVGERDGKREGGRIRKRQGEKERERAGTEKGLSDPVCRRR